MGPFFFPFLFMPTIAEQKVRIWSVVFCLRS